jgi:hypothetical protein
LTIAEKVAPTWIRFRLVAIGSPLIYFKILM